MVNSEKDTVNSIRTEANTEELSTNIPMTIRETGNCELTNNDLAFVECCENGVQVPQDFTFKWYNGLLIILSMALYVTDIAFDVKVAYNSHLIDERYKIFTNGIHPY